MHGARRKRKGAIWQRDHGAVTDKLLTGWSIRCQRRARLRESCGAAIFLITTNCLSAQGVTRAPIALTRPAETASNGTGNAVTRNAGRSRMTFGNRSTSRWYLCQQPLLIQPHFRYWSFRRASTRAGKQKIAWCGTNSSTRAKNTSSSTRSAGLRSSVSGVVFCGRSAR